MRKNSSEGLRDATSLMEIFSTRSPLPQPSCEVLVSRSPKLSSPTSMKEYVARIRMGMPWLKRS